MAGYGGGGVINGYCAFFYVFLRPYYEYTAYIIKECLRASEDFIIPIDILYIDRKIDHLKKQKKKTMF